MIRFECDVCAKPIPGSTDIADKLRHQGKEVTPGYVGAKMLCDGCWGRWKTVVYQFFKVNG